MLSAPNPAHDRATPRKRSRPLCPDEPVSPALPAPDARAQGSMTPTPRKRQRTLVAYERSQPGSPCSDTDAHALYAASATPRTPLLCAPPSPSMSPALSISPALSPRSMDVDADMAWTPPPPPPPHYRSQSQLYHHPQYHNPAWMSVSSAMSSVSAASRRSPSPDACGPVMTVSTWVAPREPREPR